MRSEIGWLGLVARIVVALLLVMATFNPTGVSYYHWLTSGEPGIDALQVLAGLLLLSGWALYARAAFQSLGRGGMVLGAAVLGASVWLLADAGWVDLHRPRTGAWIVLVALGLLLGFGLSWSILRRRWTGQVDVDEVPHP